MARIFVQFVPNQGIPFQFPAILGGTSYTCKVTWNAFGIRWFINLYNGNGGLVLSSALNATPSSLQAQFNWTSNGQYAVAVSATLVGFPIGSLVSARVTGTGTLFDGDWRMQVADRYSLIWQIPQPVNASSLWQGNIQVPAPQSGLATDEQTRESTGFYLINPSLSGYVSFIQNLVAGAVPNNGWLLYHADTQQFEYDDGT